MAGEQPDADGVQNNLCRHPLTLPEYRWAHHYYRGTSLILQGHLAVSYERGTPAVLARCSQMVCRVLFTAILSPCPSRFGRVIVTLRAGNPVQPFRGGLVFKAHSLLYDSTLGLRVIKKKKRKIQCKKKKKRRIQCKLNVHLRPNVFYDAPDLTGVPSSYETAPPPRTTMGP